MAVTYVQEIGQVTELNNKVLFILLTKQGIRLDVNVRAKSSPTSPPPSDSHEHLSDKNPKLSFGRFGRLCQSKKFGDSVFRVLAEWCWDFFGGITPHISDA